MKLSTLMPIAKAGNVCYEFSDLLMEVFDNRGSHARSVFGAISVRDNLPIIVDTIFEIEE